MGTGKGQSDGSIWVDSHESLNRCFTMAFCFACFIEQRADIHVNLALLQSARSRGEYGALFRFLFDPLSLSLLPPLPLSLSLFLYVSLFSSFCFLILPLPLSAINSNVTFFLTRPSSLSPISLPPTVLLPVNLLRFTIFHQTFSIIQKYTECTRDKDRIFPSELLLEGLQVSLGAARF